MPSLTLAAQIAAAVLAMTPAQKAETVIVTTVRPGVFSGGAGITFADQEGGRVRALRGEPPAQAASSYTSAAQAFAAGRATARALHASGIDVDFAPVFDTRDGPLGSRQFASTTFAVAFARGLGDAACAKHFPGLGSAADSTDNRPHVEAHVRPQDLAPYRTAIRQGLRCVMVDNAFYGTTYRATLEPSTYGRLRALGFDGVAVTDSLSLVHDAPVERWAPQAVRAGADIVLFTSPTHARRAVRALLPLARRGELDEHVARILQLRAALRRVKR
jgi:beta-glucosidase-like glycosyl hydrolase